MTLLLEAERLNTATQIKNWNDAAISYMNMAKENYNKIVAQKEAMLNNVDYTTNDITEIENLLLNLNTIANSLTN
jgi:phage gp37-like protein